MAQRSFFPKPSPPTFATGLMQKDNNLFEFNRPRLPAMPNLLEENVYAQDEGKQKKEKSPVPGILTTLSQSQVFQGTQVQNSARPVAVNENGTNRVQPQRPGVALGPAYQRKVLPVRQGYPGPSEGVERVVFTNRLMKETQQYQVLAVEEVNLGDGKRSPAVFINIDVTVEGEVRDDFKAAADAAEGWEFYFRLPPGYHNVQHWEIQDTRAEGWLQNLAFSKAIFLRCEVSRDEARPEVCRVQLFSAEHGRPWTPRPDHQVRLHWTCYVVGHESK